tara:strand:- start:1816 stop:2388 length:573 start_codon:yes stop_codon:yes gene_type:complete
MPLNLGNDGGSSKKFIRYMASIGSWSKSEKNENGDYQDVKFEFSQAVFDFSNIRTGWAVFAKGMSPEWVMDESLTEQASKPDDGREWKRGFKVDIFSQQMFGGTVEWSSNSTGASMGIADLYSAYEKQAEDGKLPAVKFTGVKPVKVGMGSTNVPLFEITKMVATPEELQQGFDTPAVMVADDEDDEFPA